MEYVKDPTIEVNYYLKRRFTDPYDKERGVQPFYLKSHHSFYQRFSSTWNASTAKFLEYGGGPVIYTLISAAPFVEEITFSDYQQSNIDAVIEWKKGSSESHHNWIPYFKYVTSELEGKSEPDSSEDALQRQEEVRSKCKYFLRGDINTEDIMFSDSVPPKNFHEHFDIVSSNFCCEVAATTVEEYHSNIQRLGGLVKPGGYLIGLVSLEESFWFADYGEERRFHLSVMEDDVKKGYSDAGFDIICSEIHRIPVSAQNILNDCKAIMFVAGQKKY